MKKVPTVICGHRGGGGDPESVKALTAGTDWSYLGREPDHYDYRDLWANRLKTFLTMIGKGVTCFELDLLPSRDGDAIVIHNSELDGKKIWEYSTAELQQKGWSTLDELLAAIEKTQKKITLLLEVKGSVSSEIETDTGDEGVNEISAGLIEKVLDIISKAVAHGWAYKRLPLIGFNHVMLAVAKQKNPDICIGLSYTFEQAARRMVEEAKLAGAYAINPDERLVTKDLMEAAHNAGLKVQSWTSYRAIPRTNMMIALGVDTLITDCPLEAAKLLSITI